MRQIADVKAVLHRITHENDIDSATAAFCWQVFDAADEDGSGEIEAPEYSRNACFWVGNEGLLRF